MSAHQFGRVPTSILASGLLAKVTPSASKVYLCICARANLRWQARVGVRRLGKDAGYHFGTVSAAVGQLRRLGMILTNEPRRGQPYIYTIVCELSAKCSAPAEQSSVQHPPNTQNKKCSAHHGEVFGARRTKQTEQTGVGGGKPSLSDKPVPCDGVSAEGRKAAYTFFTTGGPWVLTVAQRDKLRDAYPFVHIDAELASLAGWTEDNPGKRKKPGAMFGWLRRLMVQKQTERPLPTAAFYADGFMHTSLPTDPTSKELDAIFAEPESDIAHAM